MTEQDLLDQQSPANQQLLAQQAAQMASLNEATDRFTRGQAVPSQTGGLGMGPEAASTGGLGMAQGPPEPSGSNGSGQDQGVQGNSLLRRIFLALEAGGHRDGSMPLYLQEQKMDLERQQMLGTQADRRAMAAEKIQAMHMAQQEKQFGDAFGVMSNTSLPWSQKKKVLQGMSNNPHARLFSHVGDERTAADFENVLQHIDLPPEDLKLFKSDPDAFVKKVGGLAGVEALIDEGKANQKAAVTQNVQQRQTQRAMDKFNDPTARASMNETEIDLADKFVKGHSERALKLQELDEKLKGMKLDRARASAPIVSPGMPNMQGQVEHIVTDPLTGQRETKTGVNLQQTQAIMPQGATKERMEMKGSLNILKQAASLFHPDFVGSVDSVKNSVARMFETPVERTRIDKKTGQPYQVKEEDFRVAYDMVQKELRKVLMGTAQSVQEITTNPLAFPQASDRDADKTIPAFFRTQMKNLVLKMDAQDQVMEERRRQSPLPMSVRYQQLMQNASATDAKGNNALGFKTPTDINQAIAERLHEEVQRGWVIP